MQRIVSLIASATEIVHALGAGDRQVGRSHECDFPSRVESLPVCTEPRFPVTGSSSDIDAHVKQELSQAVSVYQVHEDVLESLRPTHIITQSQCEVCAVSFADVERALAQRFPVAPGLISLQPDSLADVWTDIGAVADGLEMPQEGQDLVRRMQSRMKEIEVRAAGSRHRPRVACIEWLEPIMAAGNWMPELVSMAGGLNLFGEAGRHSPYMEWESLVDADPDILVILPCGFDLQRAESEMYWLSQRPEWNSLRAVREGQVFLTEGNQYLNRPGPRLVDSLRILAEIVHPQRFPPTFKNVGWKQFE